MMKEYALKEIADYWVLQGKASRREAVNTVVLYLGLQTHNKKQKGGFSLAYLWEPEYNLIMEYLEASYSDKPMSEKKVIYAEIREKIKKYYSANNSHPLVTNPDFLNLHYFPDTIPYNLEEIWYEE